MHSRLHLRQSWQPALMASLCMQRCDCHACRRSTWAAACWVLPQKKGHQVQNRMQPGTKGSAVQWRVQRLTLTLRPIVAVLSPPCLRLEHMGSCMLGVFPRR